MNLCLARRRKNRGLHFGEALVNRQDALLHMRFAKAGDAQLAAVHAPAEDPALKPRKTLLAKKRFKLARWARQQHDSPAGVFQPQTRRGASRILEYLRALRHHRLAHVHFRHFPAQAAAASFDIAQNRVVAPQLAAQQVSNRLPRQVILGRSKAAAGDDQWHTIQRVAKRLRKQIAIITDNRLPQHFNTNSIQLLREEERVRVQAVRREQCRANRNDLRFHSVNYMTNGSPRTPQSSVNSALTVVRMARPDGCNASPTKPEPLNTVSA